MQYVFLTLFSLLFSTCVMAQEKRVRINGTLLYRNTAVIAANVVNNTAQQNTITDGDGNFVLPMRVGDEIIFSSVQFKISTVKVTPEIIQKNRLVVALNERVNELDEIVITPENTEKFLDLKKEEFKKVDYLQDKSTKVENRLTDDRVFEYGLNFVNIAKLLAKALRNKTPEERLTLTPSKILPYVFEETFFTQDLAIPQDQVVGFLEYLDKNMPSDRLLKKDREFQLIEYLYHSSEAYKTLYE